MTTVVEFARFVSYTMLLFGLVGTLLVAWHCVVEGFRLARRMGFEDGRDQGLEDACTERLRKLALRERLGR